MDDDSEPVQVARPFWAKGSRVWWVWFVLMAVAIFDHLNWLQLLAGSLGLMLFCFGLVDAARASRARKSADLTSDDGSGAQ